MKKNIFTFLALSFLLCSISTVVKAQTLTPRFEIDSCAGSKYWTAATPDSIGMQFDTAAVNLNKMFTDYEYTAKFVFSPTGVDNAYIKFTNLAGGSVTTDFSTTLPDSIKIPNKTDSVMYVTFIINGLAKNKLENCSITAVVVAGGVFLDFLPMHYSIAVSAIPQTFYTRPTYKVTYDRPTTLFEGVLNLNIEGGTKELLRSLNGGLSWELASKAFTKSQIANLVPGSIIWLKEPRSGILEAVKVGGEDGGSSGIPRAVTIPPIKNATTNPAAGLHFAPSRSSFCFEIMPTGENVGMVPVVKTDRTTISDADGVRVTSNGDGSFTACILYVQTPVNINVTFTMGNADVEGNNVWASNGQLYISTVNSGNAQVYNTAGALVKTINFTAGETSNTPLSSGFYVVVINGKAHKVVIR